MPVCNQDADNKQHGCSFRLSTPTSRPLAVKRKPHARKVVVASGVSGLSCSPPPEAASTPPVAAAPAVDTNRTVSSSVVMTRGGSAPTPGQTWLPPPPLALGFKLPPTLGPVGEHGEMRRWPLPPDGVRQLRAMWSSGCATCDIGSKNTCHGWEGGGEGGRKIG